MIYSTRICESKPHGVLSRSITLLAMRTLHSVPRSHGYAPSVSLAVCLLLTCSLAWFDLAMQSAHCQERDRAAPESPFSDDSSLKELAKRINAEMRLISIREANLIHRRFIVNCIPRLPNKVHLHYQGLLATDNGHRLGQRIDDPNVGASLTWQVQDDLGIFGFWISTKETKQSTVKCNIEGRDVFINVHFVDGNRGVDVKLAELGNQSVREVLAFLGGQEDAEDR